MLFRSHASFIVMIIHELSSFIDGLREEENEEHMKKKRKTDHEDRVLSAEYTHFPIADDSKRCFLCYRMHKEERRTIFSCSICGVNLCLNQKRNCFVDYHTQNTI